MADRFMSLDKFEAWRNHRAELEKQRFTNEEKIRWAAMLHATWGAIAGDVEQAMTFNGQRLTKGIVVEAVCDANHPEVFGGMTREEYEFFCVVWNRPSGKRWLYKELNYA